RHVAESEEALAKALAALPELRRAHGAAETAVVSAESDAPADDAETAESPKRLVAVEEARIDARLRAGNLEGNLELIAREAELLQARIDEIRSPDAPRDGPEGGA